MPPCRGESAEKFFASFTCDIAIFIITVFLSISTSLFYNYMDVPAILEKRLVKIRKKKFLLYSIPNLKLVSHLNVKKKE